MVDVLSKEFFGDFEPKTRDDDPEPRNFAATCYVGMKSPGTMPSSSAAAPLFSALMRIKEATLSRCSCYPVPLESFVKTDLD